MEYKRYLVRRRARFLSASGLVNLPWGAAAENRDGVLWAGGKPLCIATSQNAKDYFVQDDDGRGQERGRLVTAILARLGPLDARQGGASARWEKIWADPRCRPYKRKEDEDYWLWNEAFYNAPVSDLRHIAELVGAKV